MSFTAASPVLWPVPPDWSNGVRESLAWLTEIQRAPTSGRAQHRGLRIAPRRSFSFQVASAGQERRVADALLFDQGAARWALPIWPDQQWLRWSQLAGDDSIACATAGFDFVEGGRALLWRSVRQWELVTIAAISAGGLVLAAPLQADWRAGTRILPVRTALLAQQEDSAWHDDAGRQALSFEIDEPCDWPPVAPAGQHLGFPVLEQRPEWSDARRISLEHVAATIDNDTGARVRYDLAGTALRTAAQAWKLHGRARQSAFRSLLYWLRGRAEPLWVPSWQADLQVAAPIASDAITLTVEWAGYSLFGALQPNRRDLRIELKDGRVFYRRITGAASSGEVEILSIDSPLGVAASTTQVLLVSFLTFSTGASDEIEITHHTDADGFAEAVTAFQAAVPDV